MKEIVVISGKGGTGKTTVASSFAYLSDNRNVADCDVETPNLNLILDNKVISQKAYVGGSVAYIDKDKCIQCSKCIETCRFEAINDKFQVDDMRCEGCGTCKEICKVNAIDMLEVDTGKILTSDIKGGKFVYGNLKVGADGAGKVVSEVRQEIGKYNDNAQYTIIDGSPGIGCVVIASITGCDAAVIVTEPTQSGIDDLKRVLSLTEFFNLQSYIVINKSDINKEKADEIKMFGKENDVEIIGEVPFDKYVNRAMKESIPIIHYSESVAAKSIRRSWEVLKNKLGR
ncbi:ATP-binding protein [Dethiothermospora halolimnae]|uniref:ATP-binding protein n=1 Tax=Dethiothermospora halolimnae TaxID=3114390 RepID=UPI003CCBCBA7